MTDRRTVLIDPDGTNHNYLGVIIQHPTGVWYEQQCAGVENHSRSVEGYFVPLGGVHLDAEAGPITVEELTGVFHVGRSCTYGGTPNPAGAVRLPPERLSRLSTVVESIPYWDAGASRGHLRIDENRLRDVAEAWVPVLTKEGPGILIWPNCD